VARDSAGVVSSRTSTAGAGGGPAPEPRWMEELRRYASERFDSMAWPTPAEEEWRRTDLSRVDLSPYETQEADGQPGAARMAAEAAPTEAERIGGEAARTQPAPIQTAAGIIRFDSGRLSRLFLCADWLAKGVRLMSLRDALGEFEEPLRSRFTRAVEEADNRFIPWHFSSLTHGVFLSVPPFVEIQDPFIIEMHESGSRRLVSAHVAVLLGEGARAVVVQHTSSGAEADLLANAGSTLILSDGAALSFHETQTLGPRCLAFRNASASVARDASLTNFDAAFGAGLVKTRMDCRLEGSGAEALLNGVYFCGAHQRMDIRTVQRHLARSASSRAYYKGAVKDNGRSVFQGLIEVSPGAAGTDAFLTNRNLILNDGARSDSIPSLKIGNNDVKCSHGSTTGRIDEEHLFYLMSRGFSREEAREMLVVGYFEDLLADAPEPFLSSVMEAVRARLAGASAPGS
jgi:Fe-S cluster assembly protein SufD